jgi:hypothetical protein
LGRRFDEATNYLVVDRNKPVPSPLQEATGLIPINDDINIGSFNRYYNTIPTTGNLKDSFKLGVSNFITDGFTYGVVGSPSISFELFGESRIESPRYVSNRNQNNLNVLEIVPDPYNLVPTKNGIFAHQTKDVLDNIYVSENFPTGRYNYISFDFVQTGSASVKFITGVPQNNIIGTAASELTTRSTNRIKEYFYNRRGLDLRYTATNYSKAAIDKIVGLGGSLRQFTGTVSTKIDNLKFVETDMVPFFLLATESRINQRAQSPLGAEAPFIDYGDSEFSFLDQLVISETVFTPLSNPTVVVTPGSSPTDNVSFTKGPLPTTFRDDDLISFDLIGNGRLESDSGSTDKPSSPFNPTKGTKAQSPSSPGTKT